MQRDKRAAPDHPHRGGALRAGQRDPGYAFEFEEGASVLTALFGGAVLAFYVLIGFDDSINVAEETQHPSRNYPRAMFGGLLAALLVLLLGVVLYGVDVLVKRRLDREESGASEGGLPRRDPRFLCWSPLLAARGSA